MRADLQEEEARGMTPRRFSSPHGATPGAQLLSDGRYAVMITAAKTLELIADGAGVRLAFGRAQATLPFENRAFADPNPAVMT